MRRCEYNLVNLYLAYLGERRLPAYATSSPMRLDLFLKASRLILRRPVAQEMCDAGAVRVNGLTAKSSREVKVGDTLTIRHHGRIITARVLSVPVQKQLPKSAAASLIEIISNEIES